MRAQRAALIGRLARKICTAAAGNPGPCEGARALHTSAVLSRSAEEGSSLKGHNVVALVQGSDRGIGLQFVEQLLGRYSNTRVVATCRDPAGAEHLDALHDQSQGRLEVLPLDVTKEDSIRAAAETVKSKYGHVNLLINSSGIFHVPNLLQPESTMRWLNGEAVLTVFQVNALGPMLVTKHFTPLLEAGALQQPQSTRLSVVANLSSRTGSITDNTFGGWYSYRASKAALNQFTKTAAAEYATRKMPVLAVCLYPGTVDTDLSRPFLKHLPLCQVWCWEIFLCYVH